MKLPEARQVASLFNDSDQWTFADLPGSSRAWMEDGLLHLSFEYNDEMIRQIKSLYIGAKWSPVNKTWRIDLSTLKRYRDYMKVHDLAWFLEKNGFIFSQSVVYALRDAFMD